MGATGALRLPPQSKYTPLVGLNSMTSPNTDAKRYQGAPQKRHYKESSN
jgi:hypothetical protein